MAMPEPTVPSHTAHAATRVSHLLLAGLAALAIAACGNDAGATATSTTPGSPSPQTVAPTAIATTAPASTPSPAASGRASGDASAPSASGAITKDEFVASANAICGATMAEQDEQRTADNFGSKRFFYDVVVPGIREDVEEIRALGYPAGDEETLAAIMDDTDVLLDELAADEENFGLGPNPFADLNGRLAAYGLTTCAG